MNLTDYERELEHALNNLKELLANAQTTIGVVESMLWLIRKESQKAAQVTPKEEPK